MVGYTPRHNMERIFNGTWDAERILRNYLGFADEDGTIQIPETKEKSPFVIKLQRFLAALRAYGMEDYYSYNHFAVLGETCSIEKRKEFCRLANECLPNTWPGYTINAEDLEYERHYVFQTLFRYRKSLLALEQKWSGVLECSKEIGIMIRMTNNLYQKHVKVVSDLLDKMLLLLMGDNYDQVLSEKDMLAYGYPDITDEELSEIEMAFEP